MTPSAAQKDVRASGDRETPEKASASDTITLSSLKNAPARAPQAYFELLSLRRRLDIERIGKIEAIAHLTPLLDTLAKDSSAILLVEAGTALCFAAELELSHPAFERRALSLAQSRVMCAKGREWKKAECTALAVILARCTSGKQCDALFESVTLLISAHPELFKTSTYREILFAALMYEQVEKPWLNRLLAGVVRNLSTCNERGEFQYPLSNRQQTELSKIFHDIDLTSAAFLRAFSNGKSDTLPKLSDEKFESLVTFALAVRLTERSGAATIVAESLRRTSLVIEKTSLPDLAKRTFRQANLHARDRDYAEHLSEIVIWRRRDLAELDNRTFCQLCSAMIYLSKERDFVTHSEPIARAIVLLDSEVGKRAGRLQPVEIVTLLDCFSQSALHKPRVYSLASKTFADIDANDLSDHSLAVILESYSRVGRYDEMLIDGVVDALYPRLSRLPKERLSNVAFALARLHLDRPEWFDRVFECAERQIANLNFKQILRYCWCAGIIGDERYHSFWDRAMERLETFHGRCAPSQAIQLCQAALALCKRVPEPYWKMFQETERNADAQRPLSNRFEEDVGNVLSKIGISVSTQHPHRGYFLDFLLIIDREGNPIPSSGDSKADYRAALQKNHRAIAIECNGSRYHEVSRTRISDEEYYQGNHVMRERILSRAFSIVAISDHEWNTASSPQKLLRSKLRAAGVLIK